MTVLHSASLECWHLLPSSINWLGVKIYVREISCVFWNEPKRATTVQTLNSCTCRPDVCQCPVVQTPMDNLSKNDQIISMRIKAPFSYEVIHASMPKQLGGNRHAVVYYARAVHAFSIEIWHCRFNDCVTSVCVSCGSAKYDILRSIPGNLCVIRLMYI